MIGGGGINTKAIADELLFLFFFYLVIAPVNIFFLDVVSVRSSFVVFQDRLVLTFLWLVKRFRLLWQNRVDAPLITRSCVSHCFQLTVQTCHKTQHLHNLSHTCNKYWRGEEEIATTTAIWLVCLLFYFLISSDFKERKREELWRNYAAEFDDVVPPTDTTNRSRRPFNNTWRLYMCPQVVVRRAGYNHCLLFK